MKAYEIYMFYKSHKSSKSKISNSIGQNNFKHL